MAQDKYTENDVRAILFFAGLSLQAQERGITPGELFEIKMDGIKSLSGGEVGPEYGEKLALFMRGEELDAEAALVLSPRAFLPSEDLETWRGIVGKLSASPFVEIPVTGAAAEMLGDLMGGRRMVYLAALVEK